MGVGGDGGAESCRYYTEATNGSIVSMNIKFYSLRARERSSPKPRGPLEIFISRSFVTSAFPIFGSFQSLSRMVSPSEYVARMIDGSRLFRYAPALLAFAPIHLRECPDETKV